MSSTHIGPSKRAPQVGVSERFNGRFGIVLCYTALIGLFDVYSTKFLYSMTTYVRRDFAVEFSDMVGMFRWVYLGACLAFIPRALADVLGRRWALWMTFVGLCMAQWMISQAQTLNQYFALLVLLAVFYKSDIYVLVVSEEAPPRQRGFYSGLVVAVSALGGVVLGFMVSRMGDAPNAWRNVARFPVCGLVIALPLLLVIRETTHFKSASRQSSGAKWILLLAPFLGRSRRPLILISLLKVLVVGVAMAAVAMTHTEYLRVENGFDEKVVGRVIQCDVVASMAALVIAGSAADLVGRRFCFFLMGILYTGALSAFALLPQGSIGILVCFVVQSFASTALYIILRVASSEFFSNDHRAVGSAWTDLFMTLGAACTATALRAVIHSSVADVPSLKLSHIYLLASVCVVPAVFLYAKLGETRGKPLELVGNEPEPELEIRDELIP